jgi:cysteine desulfurase / selenocysteine lyase
MTDLRVYANNAATSYPKPKEVVSAVSRALTHAPTGFGRGSRDSTSPWAVRVAAQELLGVPEPRQVILVGSATEGLNLAICGNLKPGQRAVASSFEHNAVTRPLMHLVRSSGIVVDWFNPLDPSGAGFSNLERSLSQGATLVVMSMACNVTGAELPFATVAKLVAHYGSTLVLDASQAVGIIPIDYRSLPGRVYLAASGHKALLGPEGTGLVVVPDNQGAPLVAGGTGSHSMSPLQPETLPERYEAGTPNLPGFAGLEAAIRFVIRSGLAALSEVREHCVRVVRARLGHVPSIALLPLRTEDARSGIVAFTVSQWAAEEFAAALFMGFGIESRGGLHCAPTAHHTLGTLPDGCVRLSFGPYNTDSELVTLCESIVALAEGAEPALPYAARFEVPSPTTRTSTSTFMNKSENA